MGWGGTWWTTSGTSLKTPGAKIEHNIGIAVFLPCHKTISENDEDTPGGERTSGPKRKPVPSKLVLKAARARRARHNKAVISKNIDAADVENNGGKA